MNTEKEIKLQAAQSLRERAEQEPKWTVQELLIQAAEKLEQEAKQEQK
jgi:hypothetical protein